MVLRARFEVLKIAPLATLFAFMVGITLGPARGLLRRAARYGHHLHCEPRARLPGDLAVLPAGDTRRSWRRVCPTTCRWSCSSSPLAFSWCCSTRATDTAAVAQHHRPRSCWCWAGLPISRSSRTRPMRRLPDAVPALARGAGPVRCGRQPADRLRLGGLRELAHGLPDRPGQSCSTSRRAITCCGPDLAARGHGTFHAVGNPARTRAGPLIVDFCLRIGYTTILFGNARFLRPSASAPESPRLGNRRSTRGGRPF